jgi:hypothetical protein
LQTLPRPEVAVAAGFPTLFWRAPGRVSMALHITKKPFIMKLAMITGVAVAIATAAGLLVYLWIIERSDDPPEGNR